jgi:hypothetical protein
MILNKENHVLKNQVDISHVRQNTTNRLNDKPVLQSRPWKLTTRLKLFVPIPLHANSFGPIWWS